MIKMYWRIGWLGVVVFVAVVHEHCAQNLPINEDIHSRADLQHEYTIEIWFQNSLKYILRTLFDENRCKECLERTGEFRLANYLYEKKRHRVDNPAWYEQSVKNLARTMQCRLGCTEIIVDRIAQTNRPPTIRCPDSITVSAERRQEGDRLLGRRVHWNEPTATDLDGDRLIFYSDDEPSGSFFTAGHHKICYEVNDQKGGKDSCEFSIHVEVIRCRRDLLVNHGTNSCNGKNVAYGDRCTISCDPGYQLVGSGNLVCQYEGDYSSLQPSCEAIVCPELRLPTGGLNYNCTKGRRYKSHCYLLCDRKRGFRLVITEEHEFTLYPGSTECLKNATWSSQPTCRDASPPQFTNCPTGPVSSFAEKGLLSSVVEWDEIRAVDNVDRLLNISHTEGPKSGFRFSVGDTKIRYEVVDSSGNKGSSCIFYVHVELQNCKPPQLSDRYNVMTVNCTPNLILGAECSFSCRLGLTLTGSPHAYCEMKNDTLSWTWSNGKPPSCEKKACGSLPKPQHGVLSCDMWIGGEMCSLECDTGYLPPRGYEKMWVCSLMSDRWEPSVVPKCIPEVKPIGLKLSVRLKIITDCTDEKTAIISKSVREFIMLSGGILSHCISCEFSEITTTCRHHSALVRLHFLTEVGNDTLEAYGSQLTNVGVGMNNVLKRMQNIPGIQSTSIVLSKSSPRFVCPEGFVRNGNACAGCSPGTKFFQQNKTCTLCPQGSYQDKVGQFRCERCPAGTDTQHTGSDKKTDCRKMCYQGEYYNADTGDCQECPVGTYKDNRGENSCIPCDDHKTTLRTGSVNSTECIEKCNRGTYSDTGLKPCILCGKGFFQDKAGETLCIQCPGGKTTLIQGARSSKKCLRAVDVELPQSRSVKQSTVSCDRGEFYNADTGDCQECQVGTYQDNRGQNSCISCDGHKTTLRKGSVNSTECKELCDRGEFYNADTGDCQECPVGTYQDNRGENSCIPCDDHKTTLHKGSVYSTECKEKCNPGTYSDTGLKPCILCGKGFFQEKAGETLCTQCTYGETTLHEGSLSYSKCQRAVDVELPQSRSIKQSCDRGEFYNAHTEDCQECPVGTYQDNRGENSCIQCDDHKTTLRKGSVNSTECKEKCNPGTYSDTGLKPCILCGKGFFQQKAGETLCIQCPGGKTTLHQGARSSKKCLKMCDRGTKSPSGTRPCTHCEKGFYQNSIGATDCIKCPEGKTTKNKGTRLQRKCKDLEAEMKATTPVSEEATRVVSTDKPPQGLTHSQKQIGQEIQTTPQTNPKINEQVINNSFEKGTNSYSNEVPPTKKRRS